MSRTDDVDVAARVACHRRRSPVLRGHHSSGSFMTRPAVYSISTSNQAVRALGSLSDRLCNIGSSRSSEDEESASPSASCRSTTAVCDDAPAFAIRLVSMLEAFDKALLTRFYVELMVPNFPLEDERDDLDDWLFCLDPACHPGSTAQGPIMDVILLLLEPRDGPSSENDNKDSNGTPTSRIVAGIAVEYYRQARVGLLSYMVVSKDFRRKGVLSSLHPVAYHALQVLHHQHMQKHLHREKSHNSLKPAPLFAETNTVDAGDGPPKTIRQRHEILYRLGYRHIQFPYIQPPLIEGGDSFDEIMLLLYCGLDTGDQEPITKVDSGILMAYVADFYQSVLGYNNILYKEHWYWKLLSWYCHNHPTVEVSDELPWEDVTNKCRCRWKNETSMNEA